MVIPRQTWLVAGLSALSLAIAVPAVQAQVGASIRNSASTAGRGFAGSARAATPGQLAGARNNGYFGARRPGYVARPPINPYYATGAYAPTYTTDPVSGYMSGTADIINSQGEWFNQFQQASLTKEHVKQATIDTRRKSFDEWLYERNNTPTPEDDRERARVESLRRSLNDPPACEIYTGQALNTILADLQRYAGRNAPGPNVPLDTSLLRSINFSTGATTGSLGVFKDGGKLHWPLVLKSAPYKTNRQRLEELAPAAVSQARTGNVDADTLDAMNQAVQGLNDNISQQIDQISPNDYCHAKEFLRQVQSGIKALQDPNVASLLGQQWTGRCDNVKDLVDQMTRQGLRFAAAVTGQEPAYAATYSAMAAYDTGTAELARAGPGGPPPGPPPQGPGGPPPGSPPQGPGGPPPGR